MNGITWDACCQKAIQLLSKVGVNFCSRAKTVMGWHPTKLKKKDYGVPDRPDGTPGLRTMIASMPDFENEETRLQYVGRKLGIVVDRSPKYHPEVAGEGIEYSWGCAKGRYRYLPLQSKKGKAAFIAQVRTCLDPSDNLNLERIRKFARRQREYICAYHMLHVQEQERQQREMEGDGEGGDTPVTPKIIERYVKLFKSHRCIFDSEKGFLNAVVKESEAV